MVSSHTALAIAQTAFYTPAVPISLYIFIRNWKNGPRIGWWPLVPFSLIRLVGGIIVIVLSSNQENTGLIIAAIVLLNVGTIPLLISTVGLILFVIKSNFKDYSKFKRAIIMIRVSILAAVGLLIAGGSLIGRSTTSETGRDLSRVGYIFLAIALAIMIILLIRLEKSQIAHGDAIYVRGAILAMPLLVLRTVDGLLYEFTSNSLFSMWNPVFGSAVAFAFMALLPEYMVLVAYLYLGFHRIRSCSQQQLCSNGDDENSQAYILVEAEGISSSGKNGGS